MKNSSYIIPISILFHLVIINGTLYALTPETYLHFFPILYYNVSWLLITYGLNFYPTRRKEHFMTNIHKSLQLYVVYGMAYFTLFAFQPVRPQSMEYQLYVLIVICLLLMTYRVFFYWFRNKYRAEGGNYANVVVIGRDKNLKKIRAFFDRPELGYRYKGYFDNSPSNSSTYLGEISETFDYLKRSSIDEIFCMASRLSQTELKNLIHFADNNLMKLKIIPDNKEVFSRAMTIELYDTVPVLNMRKLPMDNDYARATKRVFDLLFSLLVIIGILSWLIPLLSFLIKLESPGPVFFKQIRHGEDRKIFSCHKFRSMTMNKDANAVSATKNDDRVTRIGKIMRRTSIDELPQFLDVFMGHMSVVGPRPHMRFHTTQFENSVDKYLVRHFVKPGITGLAQVKGYRGEIRNKRDIINRTRFDIFYVENWSLAFDIRIIYDTIMNVFKGDDKAY